MSTKLKYLLHLCLLCSVLQSAKATNHDALSALKNIDRSSATTDVSSVVRISESVYAGKGFATSGEPIFFGMELIDELSESSWIKYKLDSEIMSTLDGAGGIATYLRMKIPFDFDERYGFSEDEFSLFVQKMRSNGFENEESIPTQTLAFLRMGTMAFSPTAGKTFVAYASKSPVTGKYPFAKQAEFTGFGNCNIKKFFEVYDDLLICTGVSLYEELEYENRGIFKNPKHIIDCTYKGISMPLQVFTGAVISLFFKNIKYLVVRPEPMMHNILCKNLKPDEMYIEKGRDPFCGFVKPPQDLSILDDPEAEQAYLKSELSREEELRKEEGYRESKHLIKVVALARIYEENLLRGRK